MPAPAVQTLIVAPGPRERSVRTASGEVLEAPPGWVLLPPGDAGLTRRVKAAGPTWTVQERRGRKLFSRGVWAPAEHVERARAVLAEERAAPSYERRLEADRSRRQARQVQYVEDFRAAVLDFLRFDPRHGVLAEALATAVTTHATPVGSGTVARTERIPLEERAEAAVIAWMRHQTTAYDDTAVPRIRGARRELRRALAQRSKVLLDRYRRGEAVDPASCPLATALARTPASAAAEADGPAEAP